MTRGGETYTASALAGRQHGRDLIPCIRTVLGTAHLTMAEIELVGVGVGPGSYTGLRVGVMAAKTIAYATGALLVGLDTLEAIALNAAGEATRIAVIADAQRRDLYAAEWERDCPGGPLRLTKPCQVEPMSAWLRGLGPTAVILGPALESATIRASIPPHRLPADPGPNFPAGQHLINWPSKPIRREHTMICGISSPVTCAKAPPRKSGRRAGRPPVESSRRSAG